MAHADHILNDDRTPEGKKRRQREFLKALESGQTWEECIATVGIGKQTPHKWLYSHGTHEEQLWFREAVKAAKTRGELRASGTVPDFLTFREEHFAYMNLRKTEEEGLHPKTGQPWWSRSFNSDYQRRASRALDENKRLIMVMPPGHLKSTIFGVERTVWQIMRNRNFRKLLIQKNEDEAKKQVGQVQERLQHDYYHFRIQMLEAQGDDPIACPVCLYEGNTPFKPEFSKAEANAKWGATGFIVGGRTSGEKDYTMEAKGVGSAILGIRADEITLDDIQLAEEGKRNPKASTDKLEWVRDTLLGRITEYQQFVVLANFYSPDDFAHKLLEAMPEWSVVNFPAIDERGKPLAPEYWSIKGLKAKEREVGAETWSTTWLQNEGAAHGATFSREAMLEARDEQLRLGVVPYAVSDIFVGCDPAAAASGYCAIIVWGLDRKTKQRYLIDVFNKTGMRNWQNVTDQIAEFCRQHPVRKVIIEGNNTQKAGLSNDPYFQREIRNTGAQYEVYQTVTGTGGRAIASNYDITTIGSLFDGGLITLPYGGPQDERERVDAYIDQLARWRTDEEGRSIKHLVRDMVMATLFAESAAFVLANKPKQNIIQRQTAPGWANPWSRKKKQAKYVDAKWDGTPLPV